MSVKIIAEIGINHNGDLDTAKQMIAAAHRAGAHLVKFQKRHVDTVYAGELDNPRESPWGTTQGDQKRGLELTAEDYAEIDAYCKDLGIPWFASCWDLDSLDMVENFDVPIHKIASPMLTHAGLLRSVASIGKFTLISTGMSTPGMVDEAVGVFRAADCPFALMHCISIYPCPDEKLNLRALQYMASRWPGVDLGYSGHEVGVLPSVIAVALGAKWIERHFTLDRSMYGSDQSASLEPTGLERLVKYCTQVEQALGIGIKPYYAEEQANAKKLRYWEVK